MLCLQYMKPGEGYMMLRKGAADATFTYPFYDLNSSFREDWTTSKVQSPRSMVQGCSTMTVTATAKGFEPEDGDVLVAYVNGEQVGAAELSTINAERSTGFFLSIAGDATTGIWFAIERDGEIVATTDEVMTYKANAVIGSPDEPTAINFVHADVAFENGKWYTIGGLLLQKKPTQKGVYIFNGHKVVVK